MSALRWQVVESRAREQTADEHDSGAVWVSALTLVDLAGRCGNPGLREEPSAEVD